MIMSVRKTSRQANEALDNQRAAGTHKPASECGCGTWRTPGQQHAKGDTGPVAKGATAPQCNG